MSAKVQKRKVFQMESGKVMKPNLNWRWLTVPRKIAAIQHESSVAWQ